MINAIMQAKNAGRVPVIAEIKRFSPVEGDLLGEAPIESLVRSYELGGASAISVVTGSWFKGSLAMLSTARDLTDLPILRKDTIVSRNQIQQSKDLGADAILLTTKILQGAHLQKLIDFCLRIEITPFVEVADLRELQSVPASSDIILALANRDIARKETDVDSGLKSMHLINQIEGKFGAIISASGISSDKESRLLLDSGFDGLLIGTALIKAKNTLETLRSLVLANNTERATSLAV